MLKLIIKPLEWHLLFFAFLCVAWLYLTMIVCPAVIFAFVWVMLVHYGALEMNQAVLYALCLLGLVLGLFWAENTRKNIGILTFHSYLLSTPDIDGWGRNVQKLQDNRERDL